MTAKRWSGSRRERVVGTPTSVFSLRSVARVMPCAPRAAARACLVEVLPLLPVTPTKVAWERSRRVRGELLEGGEGVGGR